MTFIQIEQLARKIMSDNGGIDEVDDPKLFRDICSALTETYERGIEEGKRMERSEVRNAFAVSDNPQDFVHILEMRDILDTHTQTPTPANYVFWSVNVRVFTGTEYEWVWLCMPPDEKYLPGKGDFNLRDTYPINAVRKHKEKLLPPPSYWVKTEYEAIVYQTTTT